VGNKRTALVVSGVVVVLAVVGVVAWFGPWRSDDAKGPVRPGIELSDPAVTAADLFASAWQHGTLDKAAVTPASGNVAGATALLTAALTSAQQDLPTVAVTKVTHPVGATKDTQATATARVTWKLDGGKTWTYATTFPLVRQGEGDAQRWLVGWTPAVVHPSLAPNEVLRVQRVAASRGRIVDLAGTTLGAASGSVTIGIRKSRSTDPAALAATVASITGVDATALAAKVKAAGADEFVEVTTLARPDYDKIRSQIQPLPGTVFREQANGSLLPANYARAVLGTTGVADAERAAAAQGRVVVGDVVGTSGIQASQDAVLAGTPGVTVQAVGVAAGSTPRELKAYPSVPGASVTVTLDQKVQTAADAATAITAKPSALVAIRVSTGDVLAVSNGPSSASGYNRAMIGRYPPGSTFKVASGFGLLIKGLTPETTVNCPATIVVGRSFKNAEGEALGSVPFSRDFAKSCNTAFIGQSSRISAAELTATAASLGYRHIELGAPLFGGSVPASASEAEHAANMIGQGKVEASPFVVALASASVANGSSLNPRLIVDPTHPTPKGAPLPPAQIAQLRELMRGVVTNGTGGALRNVPGGPVFGKTGTAEFGEEDPPETHAWFTGYQGDIAFAVLVEGGGFGGSVAAPVAARFLTLLAQEG